MPTAEQARAIRGIVETLRAGRTFFLAGHERPDGDTLGSALALAMALEGLGKRARVYSRDPAPELLRWLPGSHLLCIGPAPRGRFDAAILLECSTPQRMGGLLDLARQACSVIHIDHHKNTQAYGTFNLIDDQASSNAEQVFDILKKLGAPLTPGIATCLYVGIVTDTGRFQYSNTTPRTLRIAAQLLEAGIPAAEINHRLFSARPYPALKLLGRALEAMRLECGGRLAVIPLRAAQFKQVGAQLEHTEDIVNYGLAVPVEAAVLFKEGRQEVFASLRSRGRVDVGATAGVFGGGGHHNAAGCRLREPFAKAVLRLETALCQAIKASLSTARQRS